MLDMWSFTFSKKAKMSGGKWARRLICIICHGQEEWSCLTPARGAQARRICWWVLFCGEKLATACEYKSAISTGSPMNFSSFQPVRKLPKSWTGCFFASAGFFSASFWDHPGKRTRVSEGAFLPAQLLAGENPRVPEGVFLPALMVPKKAAARKRCGFARAWGCFFDSASVAERKSAENRGWGKASLCPVRGKNAEKN